MSKGYINIYRDELKNDRIFSAYKHIKNANVLKEGGENEAIRFYTIADPEEYENLVYENKTMAKKLNELGLSNEEIDNLM